MELRPRTQLLLLMMMMMMMMMMMAKTAASQKNFCPTSTVAKTRPPCHSCTISGLVPCPAGYRRTPGSLASDCTFSTGMIVGVGRNLKGCSFECYREVELRRCCPGFWGPDCNECPDRADRPCRARGTCSDGLGGNGTCSCQDGFTGSACEDCLPGRYGSACSSVCSCVHGLCDSGPTGTGRCTCFSGYKGPNCDQELPECASLRCQENSRCMEEALTGRLVCQCEAGYQKSGSGCTSINPCLQSVCHVHATCVHTGPNKHQCTCMEGYGGDGRVCMPVDPCQNGNGGCAEDSARCIYRGPGASDCECLPGFQSLWKGSCSLRDACKPDSCHKDANCSTVGPGQVECTCLPGYVGTGKVCYGNILQRLNELNTEPGGQWSGQLSNAITLFDSLTWRLQNLGPFTIFVPIDRGFRGTVMKTLMADESKARYLCKMHLVAGVMPFDTLKRAGTFYTLTGRSAEMDASEGDSEAKIRIHGSRKRGGILQSDMLASNGMIHIINKLMDSVSPTVDSNPQMNLLGMVSDISRFQTFKSLLEITGLSSELKSPGPLTVFAPNAAAFNAMTEGYLQYLRSPEGRYKLLEFMRNHLVLSTSLEVFNAVSNPRIMSAANQILNFNVTENGQLLVNGVAVLEAAVEAKNGRLYVLNGVLTPASIEPLLPHRCDVQETKVTQGECVSCSKVSQTQCSSGVYQGSIFGCTYSFSVGIAPMKPFSARGCAPLCNSTVTTAACCKGFYGPDCRPCPGGYKTPCSGNGQCSDGIEGNGSCVCEKNIRGSSCQYCSSSNKYGPKCEKTCPCIHGQCDNRPDSDGKCLMFCQSGFFGRFCQYRSSPCGVEARRCHAHADCDFRDGTARCVCRSGFEGDGTMCVESDPCAPPLRGGCSVNAKCIRTGPGTRTCQCLTGWTGDGDECQPINKCNGPDRGGCHDNATCIYVGPGQSDCMCKAGYHGNGQTCEPVNQCVTVDGGCHYLASCRRLSMAWTCVCDDGYAGNGRVCYGSVEQELRTLPDSVDFFTWTTASGLSSSLSDQNITLLVPSRDAVSKMSPEDKTFWTTTGNLPSLIRNHVVSGICSSSELGGVSSITSLLSTTLPVSTSSRGLTVAGATITTSDLAATNGLIHIIDQVLVPDRKQSEGLLATLALRPDFSLFRSALLDHNLTDEIQQNHEFTVFAPTDAAITEYLRTASSSALDVNTTRYHVVPARRLLRTDLQQGGFPPTLLGVSFQLGVYPRDGKLYVNEARVDAFDILSGEGVVHGLTAVLPINRNRCDKVTYKRFLGECVECLFHQSKLCPNETTPDVSVKPMRCKLVRVFGGERQVSLGCRATCMRKNTEPRCCSGFFGAHCEPCPGAGGRPCSSNGACSDGVDGSGVCRCGGGFNGTACETCQGGKYGVHCDQECDCKNGRCSDGLRGDGTCECDVGWRGVHCDQKIDSGADELCGSVKCHSSANCVSPPGGPPSCLCAAGFTGNGTSCTAVDPCLVDNGGCGGFAVCKRTRPGRRDCVCNRGYAGDGLVCVEINPCLEGNGGCHADAECIHVGPNKTSCACRDGYSGDGLNCNAINPCQKENGGCPRSARCNMTGPGARSCTCKKGYVGDGTSCKGSVMQELMRLNLRGFDYDMMMAGVSLHGRGPFTVFAPNEEAHSADRKGHKIKMGMMEEFENHVRSHIVMCHTLLPADLSRPRNLTSLSGYVLTTGAKQGTIFVNQANVTRSDDESFNGIIHEINMVLNPLNIYTNGTQAATGPRSMNLTDVAQLHGYKTFYKLLEDTGVMDMVNDVLHQPVTVFLPSDAVMAALPQEQKDFLLDQHNRPQLLEYLKYHVVQGQRVHAEDLVYLDSARTLQGSLLSFACGDVDNIGAIFVNDDRCRVVQRHLGFRGGIAYGIDCLLTPPSLGGRCDEHSTVDLTMKCRTCFTSPTRCPDGTKQQELQKCDLPSVFVAKDSGCRSICRVGIWKPRCCRGYYGRDCLACPGGARSPCNNHGTCDDGHLGNGTCACQPGFGGVACELCSGGFYGPTCKACNCSEHGSCEDGRRGTGLCFCEPGWTGDRCLVQTEVLQCSPSCSPKAVCQDNNTCVCRPFYQGDGYTCTPVDVCSMWNGGCAKGATCSQRGEVVTCTCPRGHTGDGFSCQPVDPCASGDNGGCHQHAVCTMAAPGKKKCSCKDGYIGDGLTCEAKQLPISRCLQDNGGCHQDAKCTDLHFEDATLGVFHRRSERGQYRLNFTAARRACAAAAGGLATYAQLSYAQQAGMNLCAAGWLDAARVAYPTTYANPNCGFGHVGIVDYGTRKNLSETWDAFCYRMKEVQCECRPGYVGDGFSCAGNLLQVLRSTPTFSNFLTQILNFSQASESGKQFVKRLSNLTVRSTLFVPDNSGLPNNQTLSQRDIEFHLSEGQALPLSQLRNGSRVRTRVGSLSVLGVADLLDPDTLSSRFINDRFVTTADILASNGIIHVLQGPLKAPPPSHQMAAAHKAGMGVGVVLLVLLVAGVLFVGYHFYSRSAKPFRFHYFKEAEEEAEDAPPEIRSRNISNPVYEPGPEQAASSSDSGGQQVEDRHQVVISGVFDLLQES